MVPIVLRELPVPGSYSFFLLALIFGTLLLHRRKDGGRAGRFVITATVLFYWIASTPITALALVRMLSTDYPPVQMPAQARGASAIVVLGAGMETYRSRGDMFETSSREDALRVMEAARVYRLLDRPWVIVTGGVGSERHTDAERMAGELKALGVPEDRIVQERKSTSTHDHGLYVPPLLGERQVGQFVLVTSRQHIDRALRVFRKAGLDPIPSSPEAYAIHSGPLEYWLPSESALLCSKEIFYDKGAMAYYWLRGWI
jgi:uncharacterized SAM-binding protein YcdF (DUF218 family)